MRISNRILGAALETDPSVPADGQHRNSEPCDMAVRDTAMHIALWRISGIETDAEQIHAARALAMWITDPQGDRRARMAAARHLRRRLSGSDQITVVEFIDRATAFERFLSEHEEWFTQ